MRHLTTIACLLAALCCSCQHSKQQSQTHAAQSDTEKIEVDEKIGVEISGWVKRPGFHRLDANATLQDATRAAGGWDVHTDLVRLRRVRIIRRSSGQTNEFSYKISEVKPETIRLENADRLEYRAVLP
jgi:protein involved in polysaccharide export with SLBB domain